MKQEFFNLEMYSKGDGLYEFTYETTEWIEE